MTKRPHGRNGDPESGDAAHTDARRAEAPSERMHVLRPEDAPAIDFSTPVRRAETDGREVPAADDAGVRADPTGSGARPMGVGRASGAVDARDETPVRVELFGKPDCHLCDDARAIVQRVVADVGAELVEHDITGDDALMQKYGEYVPVIVVDGRQHSTWRVDAGMLARAIRAARRGRGGGRWPFRPRWSKRPRP